MNSHTTRSPAQVLAGVSVTWKPTPASSKTEAASPALLGRNLFEASPVRTGNRYPGQRNYHGHNAFVGSGDWVWYESLLERSWLLQLDFAHGILSIASQPMKITFADGATRFPDFLALHSDHRQVLYDVKPADRLTAEVLASFERTRDVASAIGWKYEVLSTLGRVRKANLDFLSNFRQSRMRPTREIAAEIVALAADGESIRGIVAALRPTLGVNALACVYSLLWTRQLSTDLDAPLSLDTTVRSVA